MVNVKPGLSNMGGNCGNSCDWNCHVLGNATVNKLGVCVCVFPHELALRRE